MTGRRFPHLGWTLGRWREPERYDHRHVFPHGGGGVGLITSHPVAVLVIAALVVTMILRLPEAFEFFFYAVIAGVIYGFVRWFRHR